MLLNFEHVSRCVRLMASFVWVFRSQRTSMGRQTVWEVICSAHRCRHALELFSLEGMPVVRFQNSIRRMQCGREPIIRRRRRSETPRSANQNSMCALRRLLKWQNSELSRRPRAGFSSFASRESVIASSWLHRQFSRRLLYECQVYVRWRGRPACATVPPVTLPGTSSQPAPPARSGAGKESGRR